MSFRSDRLRTGTGPIPGEQTFMELQRTADITHHIQFVAFSTGFGVTGVWKVPENQGLHTAFHIPAIMPSMSRTVRNKFSLHDWPGKQNQNNIDHVVVA